MPRFSALLACVAIAGSAGTLPTGVRAAESYNGCTGFITSLPAVIQTQGTWCLKQDLSTGMTSGTAISVATNNVTIDCNDFKVGGLAAGAGTTANGIHSTGQNITVRNCNVRGFRVGITLLGSASNTVEDNRLDGNTARGIVVHGDGSQILHNRVTDTGGSSLGGEAYGIWFSLGAVAVEDNRVSGVIPGGSNHFAWGIFQDSNSTHGSVVRGNHITGVIPTGFGTAFCIFGQAGSVYEANTVINPPSAAAAGISAPASSLCVGNRTGGFGINAITGGCTNGGGNVSF
ncbi:MAG TPA: right-handed parallel beta-helix repeat-containing protein [Lysobacter sp.]